jgi:single-stranded-DNA-specific exonuclease
MSTPDIATRLLLAVGEEFTDEARNLAGQLNSENARRQEEEAAILGLARRAVETDPAIGAHNLLVVSGDGWHRGVIGIVASKLTEAYRKPSVVISVEEGVAHGSCRSLPGFDMLGALERCADLFVRFGGHRQAAGLTMDAARIPELRARLGAHADAVLSPDDLRARVYVDAPLPLSAISPDVVDHLRRLAPFGSANPKPVFEAAGVEIASGPTVMKDRHLSMTVRQDGRVFRAVAWRAAEHAAALQASRSGVDLAYHVERNEFRGETSIELNVCDMQLRGDRAPAATA